LLGYAATAFIRVATAPAGDSLLLANLRFILSRTAVLSSISTGPPKTGWKSPGQVQPLIYKLVSINWKTSCWILCIRTVCLHHARRSENLARQHTLNPHPHRSSQKLNRPLRRPHLNMEASTFAVHDPAMSAVHIGLPSLIALPNYDPTFLRKKMRSIRPLTWLCHRQAFPGRNFSTVA
jgi:hypothetical protein